MWLLLDRPFDVQCCTLDSLKSLFNYKSVQLTNTFHNRNSFSERTLLHRQLLWNRDLSNRIMFWKSCEPKTGLPHIPFLGTGIAYSRYKDSQWSGRSGFWIPVGTRDFIFSDRNWDPPSRGEFRPRQTRQLPRAVDLKGRLLSCQSY